MIIIIITLLYSFFALLQSNDDCSAEYVTMPAGPVNQYQDGEIIAIATDADGPIIAAAISEGELPEGIVLVDDGTILVVDHTKLLPGSHTLEVVTVDNKGGMSTHKLNISFHSSGKADRKASYKVYPPKPVNQYKNQETLIIPADPDGKITDIKWVKGLVPPGTEITTDGKMVVTDQNALKADSYDVQLITYDERGGATLFSLTVTLSAKDSLSSK